MFFAKHWEIIVAVCLIFLLGFLFWRDSLADAAWQKYRSPAAALALVGRDAGLSMQLGNYYFNGGAYDLAKAERAYRKAVVADPKILWGHYQLARIIFVKGKYAEALAEINKELEANPENLRSLYVRGLIYGYGGNLAAAEDDFRRFTEWAPKEWAGYNDLAWILQKEAKYEKAEKILNSAFKEALNAEKNPWLWNGLGVAELNLGKFEEAKKAFESAQKLADGLSLADWQAAYPGNNPEAAENGLGAFKDAITTNLRQAENANRSF
ncbi:MAG: tetratricopeptide repeat protein [Candidatus Sungbacteria bacterium]|nr:tetratricopeptide repeat protein [Candidatus Sungbacteria bacterium]